MQSWNLFVRLTLMTFKCHVNKKYTHAHIYYDEDDDVPRNFLGICTHVHARVQDFRTGRIYGWQATIRSLTFLLRDFEK